MAASAQQNAEIWSDLKSLGLTDAAAGGVMGNMSQESSMNPAEGGGGLMQWIGSRWTGLVNYARSRGLDPNSAAAQVGWFGQELKAGDEGITLQGLNNQATPAAAADYVSNNYERPAAWAANNLNREAQATIFYQNFTGQQVSSTSPGFGSALTDVSSKTAQQTGANSAAKGTDIIDQINKDMSLTTFSILTPGKSLEQNALAISLRTVFVIVGLILIIFALVAVVEKVSTPAAGSGGSAPKLPPIPIE
jgi:hypothetical protein